MEKLQTADEMTEEIPDSAAGENEEAPEEKIVQGVHNYSAAEGYVRPTDPKVLEKLEWFQDQKLALMMHWGPYSQLGVVESWALSDADAGWSRTGIDWEADGLFCCFLCMTASLSHHFSVYSCLHSKVFVMIRAFFFCQNIFHRLCSVFLHDFLMVLLS